MILGPLAHTNLPLLSASTGTIDRVTSFKLLGLHIDSSLSWANHISLVLILSFFHATYLNTQLLKMLMQLRNKMTINKCKF